MPVPRLATNKKSLHVGQFDDATAAVSAADCWSGVLSIILSLSNSTEQFLLLPPFWLAFSLAISPQSISQLSSAIFSHDHSFIHLAIDVMICHISHMPITLLNVSTVHVDIWSVIISLRNVNSWHKRVCNFHIRDQYGWQKMTICLVLHWFEFCVHYCGESERDCYNSNNTGLASALFASIVHLVDLTIFITSLAYTKVKQLPLLTPHRGLNSHVFCATVNFKSQSLNNHRTHTLCALSIVSTDCTGSNIVGLHWSCMMLHHILHSNSIA